METIVSNETHLESQNIEKNNESSFEKLKNLRNKIEKLPIEQHSEILKLLMKDKELNFTENKSGTFVNLSDASILTIKSLFDYITHLEDQEKTLNNIIEMQEQCEVYMAN